MYAHYCFLIINILYMYHYSCYSKIFVIDKFKISVLQITNLIYIILLCSNRVMLKYSLIEFDPLIKQKYTYDN